MDWDEIFDAAADWSSRAASVAAAMQKTASNILTAADMGYYWHPDADVLAVYPPEEATLADKGLCKLAASRVVGDDKVATPFLSYQDLEDPECRWVKVAYSPTLRRAGELLNFFPGQYPGGIPNAPSPVAAMLTSGLLGAGLGYGAGRLVQKVLPDDYGYNLGRTGALVGGLLGAAPGAAWGATNKAIGAPFNDPFLLDHPAGAEPDTKISTASACPLYDEAVEVFVKRAFTFDNVSMPQLPPTAVDVNIDALGRTLWETGAPPAMAATTMGAMYAAQQMPSPRARPGWATGDQLGQLAANAAGDYAKGLLAGAAINAAIGTPLRATTLGAANMGLGIIGAVVPKLFGH